MKKILVILVVLILCGLTIIYLLIPLQSKFSTQVVIHSKAATATRMLTDMDKWTKWFPHDSSAASGNDRANSFEFRGYQYTVENTLMNFAQVAIAAGNTRATSLITVLELDKDSAIIEWKGEILKGINPVKRVQSFFQAKNLERNANDILLQLKKFVENQESVYGINIIQIKVVDTLLISKKFVTKSYPTTAEIYSAINELKNYIAGQGAKETNPPMLNIQNNSEGFRTMIALPISKAVPEKKDFVLKTMVPGKILVTEVNGGNHTANEALHELNQYIIDNDLSSPAIPFQSLITDRSQEPDSSKWTTKVYYPIY